MNDPYIRKHDEARPELAQVIERFCDDVPSEDEDFVPDENEQCLFHYKWLQMKSFKRWIEEDPDDDKIAVCKYCDMDIPAKMSILLEHRRTQRHKTRGAEYRDTHWAMTQLLDDARELSALVNICKDMDKSDAYKQLRLVLYTIMNPKMARGRKRSRRWDGYLGSSEEEDYNEPESTSHDLLYRDGDEEDPAIPIELSRDRCVALVTKVLAPYCRAQIVEDVGDGCFSLYIDHQWSWKRYFALVINYISSTTNLLVTTFLTLVPIEKPDDTRVMADALKKTLSDYGLNLNKLTGIAADDGNRGEGNELFKILKKDLQNLILVPCLHHSAQTVCSEAALHPMDDSKVELTLYHANAFFTDGREWGESFEYRYGDIYMLLWDEDDPMNELTYEMTPWSHRLPAVRQLYKNWDKVKAFFDEEKRTEESYSAPDAKKLLAKDEIRAHLAVLQFILSKFEPIHNMLDVKEVHSFRVYEEMERLMTYFHNLIANKPGDDVTMKEDSDDVVMDESDDAARTEESDGVTMEESDDVKTKENSDVITVEEKNDVSEKEESNDVAMDEKNDVTKKEESGGTSKDEKSDVTIKKSRWAGPTVDVSKWNTDRLFSLVDHDMEGLDSEQKTELSELMIRFIVGIIEQLKGRIPDKSIKNLSALYKSEGNVVADEMLNGVADDEKTKIMEQISKMKTSRPSTMTDEEFWEKLNEDSYKDLLKFCQQKSILPHINIQSGRIIHAMRYVNMQHLRRDPKILEFLNCMLIVRYFMKMEDDTWQDFMIEEDLEAAVTAADLEVESMGAFWFDKTLKIINYTNDLI